MANFKNQIEDLAGAIPSTADGEQFLKDGMHDVHHRVLKHFPDHIPLFSKEDSVDDAGTTIADTHITSVARGSVNASKINPTDRFAAVDSSSLSYATDGDPVWYIYGDKIFVKPTGGSPTYSHLQEGTLTNWDASSSAISYFPEDMYNSVVLFASIKVIQHKMIEMHGNTDIATALTAANTELDETQAICDLINTQADSAVTNIVAAVTEAAEIVTQTDNSSDFNTALVALNSAIDKFRADGGDPALFGDETQYETGVGLTHIRNALSKVENLIDGATMGGDTEPESAQYWLKQEDTEMVNSTLAVAQTEIARANASISEWNTTAQTLSLEIESFAKEVQARASFTGAKMQAVQAYISSASSYLQAAQGYAAEISTKINIAAAYGTEAQVRMADLQQEYQWYASRLADLKQEYELLWVSPQGGA